MAITNIKRRDYYSNLVHDFAEKLGIDPNEASALLDTVQDAPQAKCGDLDNVDLLLAVSISGDLRNAHNDIRFRKLKTMLKNNDDCAVKPARKWFDKKITFEDMLAAV
jgi:hypothetical protein